MEGQAGDYLAVFSPEVCNGAGRICAWCLSPSHLGASLLHYLEQWHSLHIHHASRLLWQLSSGWRNNPLCRLNKAFYTRHQKVNRSCSRELKGGRLGAQTLRLPAKGKGREGGVLSEQMKATSETSRNTLGTLPWPYPANHSSPLVVLYGCVLPAMQSICSWMSTA